METAVSWVKWRKYFIRGGTLGDRWGYVPKFDHVLVMMMMIMMMTTTIIIYYYYYYYYYSAHPIITSEIKRSDDHNVLPYWKATLVTDHSFYTVTSQPNVYMVKCHLHERSPLLRDYILCHFTAVGLLWRDNHISNFHLPQPHYCRSVVRFFNTC